MVSMVTYLNARMDRRLHLVLLITMLAACSTFRLQVKPKRLLKPCEINDKSRAPRRINTRFALTFPDAQDASSWVPYGVLAASLTLAITQVSNYVKMQLVTASTIGGMPSRSTIVELDAKDAKNIFYLPKGSIYTAVMTPKTSDGKSSLDEQLVLESIGRANRDGLQLEGKVRAKTQDIPSLSTDCVLSVGALARSSTFDQSLKETYRLLKPGGLFVFIEPDDGTFLMKLSNVFPEVIVGGDSAGEKRRKGRNRGTILGAAEELRRGGGSTKKRANRKAASVFTADAATENVIEYARTEDVSVAEDDVSDLEGNEEGSDTFTTTPSSKPISRPGISYERISNILGGSFVVGIAVRP